MTYCSVCSVCWLDSVRSDDASGLIFRFGRIEAFSKSWSNQFRGMPTQRDQRILLMGNDDESDGKHSEALGNTGNALLVLIRRLFFFFQIKSNQTFFFLSNSLTRCTTNSRGDHPRCVFRHFGRDCERTIVLNNYLDYRQGQANRVA